MDYSGVSIETERLRILPISLKYLDEIYREFNDEVTKYLIPQPAEDVDEQGKGCGSESLKAIIARLDRRGSAGAPLTSGLKAAH